MHFSILQQTQDIKFVLVQNTTWSDFYYAWSSAYISNDLHKKNVSYWMERKCEIDGRMIADMDKILT